MGLGQIVARGVESRGGDVVREPIECVSVTEHEPALEAELAGEALHELARDAEEQEVALHLLKRQVEWRVKCREAMSGAASGARQWTNAAASGFAERHHMGCVPD